jgi:general secretion pathway protein G
VEILVVLVIMGLLISIVAPTVLNRADEARVQKVQADFKAIETALKIYRLDNFVYPTTEQGLEALVGQHPRPAAAQLQGGRLPRRGAPSIPGVAPIST